MKYLHILAGLATLLVACSSEDVEGNDGTEGNDGVSSCEGCVIDGTCYPQWVSNQDNPCQGCDTARSTTAWSDRDGALCDDGLFCNGTDSCEGGTCGTHAGNPCGGGLSCDEAAHQCVSNCEGCIIAGVCLFDGQPNPLNPCQVCDASASPTEFVDDDGASCDDGLFCNGSDSCTGGECVVHEGDRCGGGEVCWEEFGGRCCSAESVRECDPADRVVDADSCGHVTTTVMDCGVNGSTCLEGRCLCDPVKGTGCPAGTKCTSTGARTECVADGTLGQGESCVPALTGADDCAAGLFCYPRTQTCLSLCSSFPDPAACAPDHICTSDLMSVFPDQTFNTGLETFPIDVGVCKPGCDPVSQDCSDPSQACYLLPPEGDTMCADVPSGSLGLTQGDACNDLASGGCYVGGCDKGYGAWLPGGVCTFFCTPIDNWKNNVPGLSGDPGGTTCAADFQGARPDGPGPSYECRFIESYYTNTGLVPPQIGMCVDPAAPEGGGSCADFDLDQLVLDIQSGDINNPDYCTLNPNNCLWSCISQATLDALLF